MPLVNIKTDLKSLRYGKDTPGGGDSAYPLMRTPIAEGPATAGDPFGADYITTSDLGRDFLIRGGFLRYAIPGGAAYRDVERLIKLYTKTPTGLSFNAKQLLLGVLARPTQIWNPLTQPLQTILDGIGLGHVPALLNSFPNSPGKVTSQDFLNPWFYQLPKEFNQEKTYGNGNPGDGTDPIVQNLPFGLGERIKRQDPNDGPIYKYGDKTGQPDTSTQDVLAMKPLYKTQTTQPSDDVIDKDIIKFHISVVDNNNPAYRTWITFRAFLTSFEDSFSAKWKDITYVGRGENFYKYGGFDRDISLGFKIAVQSRAEQYTQYEKLNYLASLCAPDYSDSGFMRGNLIYLTVGDYLVDVPGVMKGFKVSGMVDSSWEIARKLNGGKADDIAQLPQLIEVSGFSFSPIHNFVPQTGAKFIGYDVKKGREGQDQIKGLISLPNPTTAGQTTSTTNTPPVATVPTEAQAKVDANTAKNLIGPILG